MFWEMLGLHMSSHAFCLVKIIENIGSIMFSQHIWSNSLTALKLQSGDYQRIEQSNFPGQYDYTCQSSRVLWGCVITVHSLGEAKNFCTTDPQCRSFVLFASNPDGDGKTSCLLIINCTVCHNFMSVENQRYILSQLHFLSFQTHVCR